MTKFIVIGIQNTRPFSFFLSTTTIMASQKFTGLWDPSAERRTNYGLYYLDSKDYLTETPQYVQTNDYFL